MIEKNIFQCYWNRSGNPLINDLINKHKSMNPDYNYYLYDDKDMDEFVNKYYNGEISECYNKLNITVAKSDFWRYLVLYKYGGVYLDMDSSIEKPLNELIKEEDQAIITEEGNPYNYVQWALIFSKEHPILKKTIELICDNIKNNRYPNDIHKMTGPDIYTKAIRKFHHELFNCKLNRERKRETDIIYNKKNISYRLYGIDFNVYFKFRHKFSRFLFTNKTHWTKEQKIKPLLKVE
jgi:mannosyltransferase OCH1-like enzyme